MSKVHIITPDLVEASKLEVLLEEENITSKSFSDSRDSYEYCMLGRELYLDKFPLLVYFNAYAETRRRVFNYVNKMSEEGVFNFIINNGMPFKEPTFAKDVNYITTKNVNEISKLIQRQLK